MGALYKYHWFILLFSLCVRALQEILSEVLSTYNCWRFTRPPNTFSCKLFSLLLKRYLQRKNYPWISSSRVNEQVYSAVVNAVVFHQSKWLVLSHMIPNFVIFSAREDNRQWNTRWAFAQTYIFTCEKIAVAMATSQILIPIYLIQKRLLLRLVIDNWALSIWARELNAMINLVPRSHSVLHWKVRSPFPLAVGDLGTRLCNDLLEWPLNNSFQVHNSQCPKQSSLNQLLN